MATRRWSWTRCSTSATRELLDAYRRVLPAGAAIATLVNTHANGDHAFGNQLLDGARIVASRATAKEMHEVPRLCWRPYCGRRRRWASWVSS